MPSAAIVPPRSSSAARASAGPSSRTAPSSTPRRQAPAAKPKAGRVRQLVRPTLALITLVLIADALVGENGWFERHRQEARLAEMTQLVERVERENDELRVRAERLTKGDPAVIEDLARRNLEMLKPGELLVVDGTEGRAAANPPTGAAAPTAP